LKVVGSCPLPPCGRTFPQADLRRLDSEINRGISENERNSFYERQALGLIKRWKAELENLLINTCLEGGNGDGVIKNYLKDGSQKRSYPFNDVTYY